MARLIEPVVNARVLQVAVELEDGLAAGAPVGLASTANSRGMWMSLAEVGLKAGAVLFITSPRD